MAKGIIASIVDISTTAGQPMEMSHKMVTYRIDDQGPFYLYIPIMEYTPEKATELVRAKVKEWAKVVGKPIEER